MEFKIFNQHINRSIMYLSILALSFLIIGLIIIFALKDIETKIKVISTTQLIVNLLFTYLILIICFKNKFLVSWIYLPVTLKNAKTNEVIKKQLDININIWIISIIVFIGLFFLETSFFLFADITYLQALKQYWWIALILLGINISLSTFMLLINKFLFNKDQDILTSLFKN